MDIYACYWASLVAELVKIYLQCRRPQFDSWIRKNLWRRDKLLTPVFLGFLCGSAGKESSCNEGDLGSCPGQGRSPGEGNSYPLQYADLENSPWDHKELDTAELLSLFIFTVTRLVPQNSNFQLSWVFSLIVLSFLLLLRHSQLSL